MVMWFSLALALTPRQPLPPAPHAVPDVQAAAQARGPTRVLVKLVDGQRADAVEGTLRPLIHHDVSALVARARQRSGREQPDYGSLYEVVAPAGQHAAAARALAADDAVEVVWASPSLVPPPRRPAGERDRKGAGRGRRGAGEGAEESYLRLQRYHLGEHGVGSRDAWKLGFTGQGVRISDVEYGVNLRHEEVPGPKIAREKGLHPVNPFSENHDHGTAVMGVALARPDRAGIRGIAHGAAGGMYPINTEEHGLRTADAILAACGASEVGDIVMLELQTVAVDGYAPMEVEPDVWLATRTCVDAGVVVVSAAGNGSQDLDGAGFDYWRERGDSGAILVGAGRGAQGSRAAEDFSNYGRRVDLQGWGSEVFTLGYGDHAMPDGDPNRSYTAVFGGTSSATPMVAGVAALVQQAARSELGKPLSPLALRQHLQATGRRHQGERAVGALPDAPRAIRELKQADRGPERRRGQKGGRKGRAAAAEAPSEPGAPQEASWWASVGCLGGGSWLALPLLPLWWRRRR